MPAGPEPTTATRLPVWRGGGRGGEPAPFAARPGADDRDPLAGMAGRRKRHDPALLPAAVDDRAFDRLDRHRVVVDVQRARRLARRRADAAGEFRKIVGRVQRHRRLAPLVAIDQIVPVRDQIVDRAALVTERDAAIHATRGLRAQYRLRKGFDELLPVLLARRRLLIAAIGALDLEKPGRLAHPFLESGPAPWEPLGRSTMLTYIDLASNRG